MHTTHYINCDVFVFFTDIIETFGIDNFSPTLQEDEATVSSLLVPRGHLSVKFPGDSRRFAERCAEAAWNGHAQRRDAFIDQQDHGRMYADGHFTFLPAGYERGLKKQNRARIILHNFFYQAYIIRRLFPPFVLRSFFVFTFRFSGQKYCAKYCSW